MTFLTTQNQFVVFLFFLFLGQMYGLEQFFLSFFFKKSKKFKKFLINALNCVIVLFNCFSFYFLALRTNFGIVRWFMFLGFVVGALIVCFFIKILNKIKIAKIQQ